MRAAVPPSIAPHVQGSLASARKPASHIPAPVRHDAHRLVQTKSSKVVQRTTIALSYDGESEDSQEKILEDATAFHNAHGTGRLIDQSGNVTGVGDVNETRIDVFAHGNQAEVGDYTPEQMAVFLLNHQYRPRDLEGVVIHACESASLHPGTGKIYSHRLHREMIVQHARYVEVTGHAGRTFTDSTGQSRVLIDNDQELAYRQALAEALAGLRDRGEVEDEFLRPVGQGRLTFGFDAWEEEGNMYGQTRQETIDNLEWIRTETESPASITVVELPYH
jgi:hypothetical protein